MLGSSGGGPRALNSVKWQTNVGGGFSSPIQQGQVPAYQGWARGSAETPREQWERPAAGKMLLPSKLLQYLSPRKSH